MSLHVNNCKDIKLSCIDMSRSRSSNGEHTGRGTQSALIEMWSISPLGRKGVWGHAPSQKISSVRLNLVASLTDCKSMHILYSIKNYINLLENHKSMKFLNHSDTVR